MTRGSAINIPSVGSRCTVGMVCHQGKLPLSINIRTGDNRCSFFINMPSAQRKLSLKSSCKIINLRSSCCLLLLLLLLVWTLPNIVSHLLTRKALYSAQILLLPILLLGPTLLGILLVLLLTLSLSRPDPPHPPY